jgi:hypothetical protein
MSIRDSYGQVELPIMPIYRKIEKPTVGAAFTRACPGLGGEWSRHQRVRTRKLGQDMRYASAEIKGSCFEPKICPGDVVKSSKVAKLKGRQV